MLANIMEGHVLALSLQMYGCRVVQKVTREDLKFFPVPLTYDLFRLLNTYQRNSRVFSYRN